MRKFLLIFPLVLIISIKTLNAAEFNIDSIQITRNGLHQHNFLVELARSDNERALGLMFRKELRENHGMLFIYINEREVNMWMKNTFISLDMLFLDKHGYITRIVRNTEPLSLNIIPSMGNVLGVLELLGGTASRLDIRIGDRVNHSAFSF